MLALFTLILWGELVEEVKVKIHVLAYLHFLPLSIGGFAFPFIKERAGLGNGDVFIKREVAKSGHPTPVRRFVSVSYTHLTLPTTPYV